MVDAFFDFLIHEDYGVQFKTEPFRWSEDFANYLQHYNGFMFGIGAGETVPELHHPDYDFPDEIIDSTAQLFIKLITHWQKTKNIGTPMPS